MNIDDAFIQSVSHHTRYLTNLNQAFFFINQFYQENRKEIDNHSLNIGQHFEPIVKYQQKLMDSF